MSGMCNAADSAVSGKDAGAGEFMLFGVRVVVDSMRKSVSMNNLSQYVLPQDASNNNDCKEDTTVAAGYASADEAVNRNSVRNRERKRGVTWTEEEHKLFLIGLQKVGKGDWRGIARNFVKTRTPTQVASHAQKYFLRRSNLNRRRRRSSLFDITTDSVTSMPMEKEQGKHQDNLPQSHHLHTPNAKPTNMVGFPFMPNFSIGADIPDSLIENPGENLTLGQGHLGQLVRPIPISLDAKASMVLCDDNMNLNSAIDPASLSLKLSLPSEPRATPSRHSAFQAMPCFENGDSIISVA